MDKASSMLIYTQPLRQVLVLEDNGDRRLRPLSMPIGCRGRPLRLRRDWPTLLFAHDPRYGETHGAGNA